MMVCIINYNTITRILFDSTTLSNQLKSTQNHLNRTNSTNFNTTTSPAQQSKKSLFYWSTLFFYWPKSQPLIFLVRKKQRSVSKNQITVRPSFLPFLFIKSLSLLIQTIVIRNEWQPWPFSTNCESCNTSSCSFFWPGCGVSFMFYKLILILYAYILYK